MCIRGLLYNLSCLHWFGKHGVNSGNIITTHSPTTTPLTKTEIHHFFPKSLHIAALISLDTSRCIANAVVVYTLQFFVYLY